MTSERDTTRLVRSWLREDDHASAATVVEAALAVIERTPQRRAAPRPIGWLGRASSGAFLRVAAAIAVLAILVVFVLPNRNPSVLGPGPSSTPTPTPSAPPSPSSSPPSSASATPTQPPTPQSILPGPSAAAFFPDDGPLAVGRTFFTRAGVSYSLDIPTAGWIAAQGFEVRKGSLGTPDAIDVILWDPSPENTYADPCARTARVPPAGPDLESMTAAVAAAPNTQTLNQTPTDVELDGHPGKQITLGIPDPLPCGGFRLWYAGDPVDGRYPFSPGSTIWVWIVDVDGTLVWIDAETYADAPGSVIAELHQLVESIRFQ